MKYWYAPPPYSLSSASPSSLPPPFSLSLILLNIYIEKNREEEGDRRGLYQYITQCLRQFTIDLYHTLVIVPPYGCTAVPFCTTGLNCTTGFACTSMVNVPFQYG